MNDYEKLKDFWNSIYRNVQAEKIESKWIDDENFNRVINTYMKENSNVLDYGSGSGWGLIELYYTKKINGIGIDPSINMVNYANDTLRLSEIDSLKFVASDEMVLNEYKNHFDFVLSVNTLDVVPDEIIDSILINIKGSMKDDSYLFVGLNPDFSVEELTGLLKMEQKGNYFYKDGIMRCNKKSIEEWNILFKKYFEVIENFKFALTDREKQYPRVGFVLKK